MNIEATKLELMHLLLQTQKKTLLSKLRRVFEEEQVISSERISIEQYNKELDASIADIEAGNYHTHEEVKSMISQWGRK